MISIVVEQTMLFLFPNSVIIILKKSQPHIEQELGCDFINLNTNVIQIEFHYIKKVLSVSFCFLHPVFSHSSSLPC